MNKKIITLIIALLAVFGAKADNGSNSPYSRYGVGTLSNQSLGINRQMGGLGYGVRNKKFINILNPASFSQADSVTMLFEAGFSLQNVNFEENNKRINAKNASFDYIALEFRLCKGLGMSAGFLPYSTVGYSFSNVSNEGKNEASTNTFTGSGGIYQPFIGIGWQPFKWFAIGATGSYIYGDITHDVTSAFTNSTNVSKSYNVTLSSYKVDFGAQFIAQMGKKHSLVLGATYSLGHDMHANAKITKANASQTTTEDIPESSFKMPHTYGAGFVYNYNDKFKIGADYTLQQWSTSTFLGEEKGIDCSKISLGAEFTPEEASGNFFKRMSYRAGLNYAQPYTEVKGVKGCEEFGASVGLSIPFLVNRNRGSYATVHLSGEYIHKRPHSTELITENYFRINIGITFNENWFVKMKVR